MKDCVDNTFTIQTKTIPCTGLTSCPRNVTIFIGENLKIKFEPPSVILVNGAVVSVPYSGNGVSIGSHGNHFYFSCGLGFRVKWDGHSSVYVTVEKTKMNKLCGLCGTYDNQLSNDFMTSSNNVVASAATFGNSWKANEYGETCPDVADQPSACQPNSSLLITANQVCSKIYSDAFKVCHPLVATEDYFQWCLQDVCSCNATNASACACSSLTEYSRKCVHLGARDLSWRTSDLCPKQCDSGKIYKECASMCPLTCVRRASNSSQCNSDCYDGCECPPNKVLHNDDCIDVASCPCVHNKLNYMPGAVLQQDCNNW